MNEFCFGILFVLFAFCCFLLLFVMLAKLSFGAWMIIVNSGLFIMFGSIISDNDVNGVGAACLYLFVASIINLVMISAHYQISTKEGREEMYRQINAQKEYDRKYRNYVQEAKDKKGTIEYTEKKR